MNTTENIKKLIDQDLINIQKPGRYVGGEYNQVTKDWDSSQVRVALAFPDIYDIGFPNLGLIALYNEINAHSDALAERVFSPWFDMEKLLIEKQVPLFTLESKKPLKAFDVIGFSLPYETLFTNTLNMLDLSNISILSNERSEEDPIIIAGGHATYNPEPMYAFIDAFVIGEGEEIIHEIIETISISKQKNLSRDKTLDLLSEISGIYIPTHFNVTYTSKNEISSIVNNYDVSKPRIQKRVIRNLSKPIQNRLVPNINVVHDRLSIEIMRGCSRSCRFCQAGMIMRPVRELSRDAIIDTIKESVQVTGISEFSLMSLSSSDHSQIIAMLEDVNKMSEENHLDFSLPSLRIESFNEEVISSIKGKRKGNFTIAPEAGSSALRSSINKTIPEKDIFATVEQICMKGWNNIKLYFMIGFPGEQLSDIESIIHLCEEIKNIGRSICKSRFKLHVSINTLLPKPHTPFQWSPVETRESNAQKYRLLADGLRKLGIKLNYPDFDMTILESLLSRGDRRIANLIYQAWKNGAKFDAWREGFNREAWFNAIEETQIDLSDYIYREKRSHEILPWDHIDIGIDKQFLLSENQKSKSGETTLGCSEFCAACGIRKNLVINCEKIRSGEKN